MKSVYKILRAVFAIIGVIAVCMIVFLRISDYDINISRSDDSQYEDYIALLRSSGPYGADAAQCSINIIQDTLRAKEIRDYFQLDTLYSPDADTWTKTLAIGRFVASNIPHDNQREYPEHVNAIGLWEYTKNVAPAFNCRLHSIFTFELLLAAGIDAKYITCMPRDKKDRDCHVVNEVWLPELGKWAMIDTDMGGHYFTDMDGIPISLSEMREHYISGEKMMVYPEFRDGSSEVDWYYSYMAKNAYWFSCWGELSYYQEDYDHENVVRDHYFNLVPSGYKPFRTMDNSIETTDSEHFWAPACVK